jgi:hypothetical protein
VRYSLSSLRALLTSSVYRVPLNFLPLAETADSKMRAVLENKVESSNQGLKGSPLNSEDTKKVQKAFENVSHICNASTDSKINAIHPSASPKLPPFIPQTFPGAQDRGLHHSAEQKQLSEVRKGKSVESFLSPLPKYDGKEVPESVESSKSGVWRAATLAGLWMFKGLGEEIDKVRDVVWQGAFPLPPLLPRQFRSRYLPAALSTAHVLAARTAVALPPSKPAPANSQSLASHLQFSFASLSLTGLRASQLAAS